MCERAVTEFDVRGADDYVKCVSVTTVWRVLMFRMEGDRLQLRIVEVNIMNK